MNKRILTYFMFVISLILILSACKSERDKIFDNIYSKKIVYPHSLKNYNHNIDSSRDYFNSNIKIITAANNAYSTKALPLVCGDFGTGVSVCCSTRHGTNCRWGDSEGIHDYSDPVYY